MLIFTRHWGPVAIKYPRSYWNSRSVFRACRKSAPRTLCTFAPSRHGHSSFALKNLHLVSTSPPCFYSVAARDCFFHFFFFLCLSLSLEDDRTLITDENWPAKISKRLSRRCNFGFSIQKPGILKRVVIYFAIQSPTRERRCLIVSGVFRIYGRDRGWIFQDQNVQD